MTVAEIMAIGAFVVNALGAIIGLTWGVGKIREGVRDELKEDIEQLKQIIAESELTMERRAGEMGSAIREKITQVEFFVRDYYVREKDFDSFVISMAARFDRLQGSIDGLNTKMDTYILETRDHD